MKRNRFVSSPTPHLISRRTRRGVRGTRILLVLVALAALPRISWSAPQSRTIHGYVLDSACAFTKSLKKPISPACAIACAKAGSPLVILADDGLIYWPISAATPAKGQNSRLLPYAGKLVFVSGMVYERGGSHAIVIKDIRVEGKGK
jgi:hypothetical protein